jgi:hypothetical protein
VVASYRPFHRHSDRVLLQLVGVGAGVVLLGLGARAARARQCNRAAYDFAKYKPILLVDEPNNQTRCQPRSMAARRFPLSRSGYLSFLLSLLFVEYLAGFEETLLTQFVL